MLQRLFLNRADPDALLVKASDRAAARASCADMDREWRTRLANLETTGLLASVGDILGANH